MAAHPLSKAKAQEAIDAVAREGSIAAAARKLGIVESTFLKHVYRARQMGLTPSPGLLNTDDPASLRVELKRVRAEMAAVQKQALDEAMIRKQIIGLAKDIADTEPPRWMGAGDSRDTSSPGVPLLFLSDLHWGEVVHPSQINGVNRYSVDIAHKRLDILGTTATRLLSILSPKMDYPGIVLALGGDMISGNIHDELTATNEMNTMPTVLDLFGKLASFIKYMADTFGRVHVPGVTGNHGRDTHKIWGKDRHHTSFDWLLYCFLAKHFEGDKRVTFQIPDGPDAYFKIYQHRYLMTHGDQFRGGDGMIGALGPIIRGDHRKRSRNAQIDMEYDTMLLGHWHQYIHLNRLIVNGSLKGYDEYAYSNNFPYERPQQALWVTHPRHGITYRMPVFVDRAVAAKKSEWVSVAA